MHILIQKQCLKAIMGLQKMLWSRVHILVEIVMLAREQT